MEFDLAYEKYNKIIHHLLKSNQITYNYDEFYQLLLIKMWELILDYDNQKASVLHTYLFVRLKYYLIDIFRKESYRMEMMGSTYTTESFQEPSIVLNDFNLHLEDITLHLNSQEKRWLSLHLQGYKQYEIAQIMHLSKTTIKKIKAHTRHKCLSKFNYL